MYLYLYANRNRALFYAILQTPGFRPNLRLRGGRLREPHRPAQQHYGRVGTGMIPMKKRGRTHCGPAFSQVVRQRCRNRFAQIVAAPAAGDLVERGEQLGGVERCHEFQPCGLEVGQPLEIVGHVTPHFEDSDMVTLDFERFL